MHHNPDPMQNSVLFWSFLKAVNLWMVFWLEQFSQGWKMLLPELECTLQVYTSILWWRSKMENLVSYFGCDVLACP